MQEEEAWRHPGDEARLCNAEPQPWATRARVRALKSCHVMSSMLTSQVMVRVYWSDVGLTMELLYRTVLPRAEVHCACWSSLNLLALSVSGEVKNYIAEGYDTAKKHQLLVFDPNRPWDFHVMVGDCKSVVMQMDWSVDGTRLLALHASGGIHMWRMKSHCMNSWVCAYKLEPVAKADWGSTVHMAWLDHKPMATINHMKEDWPDVVEMQPFSPLIRTLLGHGFITIHSNGKVRVNSTCVYRGPELSAEAVMVARGTVTAAKTFVTASGSVLCIVGCVGGKVRVHALGMGMRYGGDFTISTSLATEFHPMGSINDTITQLLVLPHSEGCIVHICYNGTHLYQWSVKDITHSGMYQAKRDSLHVSPRPIQSLAGSSLCLGSCDAASESDLMMLDEVGGAHSEGAWPAEVVVVVRDGGDVVLLHRDSYKVLNTFSLASEEPTYPASKRARLEASSSASSKVCGQSVCLSPNACCVAVANGNSIYLLQLGAIVLGLKGDASTPEVPRCSRLLSLAVVFGQSAWDLAAVCGRLESKKGGGFLVKLLAHFSADFENCSSTLRECTLGHFLTVLSLLHSCAEDGLLAALTCRSVARLHGTSALMGLGLGPPPGSGGSWEEAEERSLEEKLQECCSSDECEESLEAVASALEPKDFPLALDAASELQSHAHWLVELSIRVVSGIATQTPAMVPAPRHLQLLRRCLLLVYLWNKALPAPVVPVTDGALALLFKVLTVHLQATPSSPLPDELLSDVTSHVPAEKHPNLLTLTKASHLLGFLCGISNCKLPEAFQMGKFPRIRPTVQRHYTSTDPFSPLTLVVPPHLSPPWRDCFVEGQRDVVHGGSLIKAVLQNTQLKQCSTCRCWTVASEHLLSPEGLGSKVIVQQWRGAWSGSCLCGGVWALRLGKRT